jgi:catechol 2,3-dioxygenase-like lactoylglutathione lyase family enzyme
MLDHITLRVSDLDAARAFYAAALEPLGLAPTGDSGITGFTAEGDHAFWLDEGEVGTPLHIAFAAKDRATVQAFHAAALAAGGTDNGGPGLREAYGPTYYAAFVHDADGHNIEAVTYAD